MTAAGWTLADESPAANVVTTEPRVVRRFGLYRTEVSIEVSPINTSYVRVFVNPYRVYFTGHRSKMPYLKRSIRNAVFPTLDVAFEAEGLVDIGNAVQRDERAPSAPTANITAFVDVELVSMEDDAIRSHYTVLVEGDRIVAVGPASDIDVPDGAVIVEGNGRFLMPGVAEMHGHVPSAGGNMLAVEETLFLYVAAGVTTVRGMLGYDGQLVLRERAAAGKIVSPTLYLAGPSFSGNSVSSPDQAAEMVRDQVAEGWNLLKIHPGLTRAEYDAVATTAADEGIRFGGHVPADVGLMHAIEMGQETFDHLDGYVEALDEFSLDAIVAKTIEAGAWVVPTMVLWETLYGTASLSQLLNFDELKYVSADAVASWTNAFRNRVDNPGYDPVAAETVIDSRMQILRALNDAGARILMGTDAPQQFSVPGFSLHREIRRMTEAGMTPYEVLKSGSVSVGEYFANEDDFGTISVGKRADMLLVVGNPLADVSNVENLEGVMVRGRWLPAEQIDARLAEIAARHARTSE